jgi:hypothetical protein
MILIFVPEITPRVEYIFAWIFSEVLGFQMQLTNDIESFQLDATSIKIEYNYIPVTNHLFFPCHDLLFVSDFFKTSIFGVIVFPARSRRISCATTFTFTRSKIH